MIDKDELLERIEDTLTTRQVKELFKSVVEECEDIPIRTEKELYQVAFSNCKHFGGIEEEKWQLMDFLIDIGMPDTFEAIKKKCEEEGWINDEGRVID